MSGEKEFTIDFVKFFKILISEKKILGLSVFISLVLSVFYFYGIKTEYTATGKILPEVAHKPINGLGGLFELLKKYSGNVDLYNTEITPQNLYVEIINTKSFYNYLTTRNIISINKKIIKFKDYHESNLLENIQKRIQITVEKKHSIVLVSVNLSNPIIAANIANCTIDYIISYITKYRTEKARQELFFIEELLKNSKKENFSKEIQNNLLASIIQMKIKIQEDTPNIQVLEYAPIPAINNNPPLYKIIIPFISLGLLVGIILVLFINSNYKKLIN